MINLCVGLVIGFVAGVVATFIWMLIETSDLPRL